MAITSAQLTSAITANQVTFALSSISGSGLPVVGATPLAYGTPMLIGSELMYVVSQPVTGTVTVRGRGSDGTTAQVHDALSFVYTSSVPGDFPTPIAGLTTMVDVTFPLSVDLGQDQTVALTGDTTYNINKTTAAAITLTAPSLLLNGVIAVFTSTTAAAHVITATSLLADGSSGSPKSTATFLANKGASLTLVAENGLWDVQAATNVTIA